ncbi:hypothetical protein RRG08_033002 [Elysia crispata]|uniref:Uncharacterized protein n=1 Tax=Elysia crispata TaxID=231223 RepID=A0AAE0YTV0_9GAST|nr:hypothetical protein RRG08_033002 [Elysia crispata]
MKAIGVSKKSSGSGEILLLEVVENGGKNRADRFLTTCRSSSQRSAAQTRVASIERVQDKLSLAAVNVLLTRQYLQTVQPQDMQADQRIDNPCLGTVCDN